MKPASRFATALAALFLSVGVLAADAGPRIERPWARPTAPGAQVGGVFLQIRGGGIADQLVAASSPAAANVELHAHVMSGSVATMRAVAAIDVPAEGVVELKPGGLHIMLIGLKAPLVAGQKLLLKLRFRKAGEQSVEFEVGQPGAARTSNDAHAGHAGH